MTTKIFTLLVTALLISSISFAKIRRVGYNGVALTGVDYADLQSANDAANAGDTIQIYTSTATTGAINKKLVIVGYGYNFDVNTNLQAIGTDAPSSANIYFYPGSDGTIVEGISGSFSVYDQTGTTTPITNITFERCNCTVTIWNLIANGPISNIKITSCVLQGLSMMYDVPNGSPVTNLQIYNCILSGSPGSFTLYEAGTTASVINCVMGSPAIFGTAAQLNLNSAGVLVQNCILVAAGTTTNINTVFQDNFFSEAQPTTLPSGSNNRWSQDWSTLFNRLGGTSDSPGYYGDPTFTENYYILKSGSPAINGGFNSVNAATDCGIFGGEAAYVYKLSGVPAVPAIYKLTVPGSAASSNPYNVTISVRSNN